MADINAMNRTICLNIIDPTKVTYCAIFSCSNKEKNEHNFKEKIKAQHKQTWHY